VAAYCPPGASAEASEALWNVSEAKAVFDVRIGEPMSAMNHLKLIDQTYKELMAADYTPAEQKTLRVIASTVSDMSEDGIVWRSAWLGYSLVPAY
jgi:hypothetical protein